MAAGHRPCGLCRREDYLSYRAAVGAGLGAERPVLAPELNRRLAGERLRRGRGLERGSDRRLTIAPIDVLPPGVVVSGDGGQPCLVTDDRLRPFDFRGWGPGTERPTGVEVQVITPPTSVAALGNGYRPSLHRSAGVR